MSTTERLRVSDLNPGQVDQMIMDVCDAMDEATTVFEDVCDKAATAEADFKGAYARATIDIAANTEGRTNAAFRDAQATLLTINQLRVYKIQEARKTAAKEALLTLRARLDALRSLGANLRVVTTGRT